MEEHPRRIIVTSLLRQEAQEAVASCAASSPGTGGGLRPLVGATSFVRDSLKDLPREELLRNPVHRSMLIEDIMEELTTPVLRRTALYRLMHGTGRTSSSTA